MKTVGIIGGIGSGKSTIAEMFQRRGAVAIGADRLGHKLLTCPDVMKTLVARWGNAILDENGQILRSAIAGIVFQTESERQFLDNLLHPLIRQEMETAIRDVKQQGGRLVLVDAPLLLEAGCDDLVDEVLFVDAPREVRLARVKKRGWSEADFDARETAQWPVEEKRRRASHVIDNAQDLATTLKQVELLCASFV